MIDLTNKNSEDYQFDFKSDARILLKQMIKKSFDLEAVSLGQDSYSGSVRFFLNVDTMSIYVAGENDSYFVKDLYLGEVNSSEYIEARGPIIRLKNQESLESFLLLSALSTETTQENLFIHLKETCCGDVFFNRKELKVNNIKLSVSSVESFVQNPVMVNYFFEAFSKALETFSLKENKKFTIQDIESLFRTFYCFKNKKEVDPVRFKFIEKTLYKDFYFNNIFSIFKHLYLKLDPEIAKLFDFPVFQLEKMKSDQEKAKQLFNDFITIFKIKEVPISFIWETDLFLFLKDEVLESLTKNKLVLKSSDYACDLRVLSNEEFDIFIKSLKVEKSKLELNLSLKTELSNNSITLYYENEFLIRLKQLKELSENIPLTIKGLTELTGLVQARIDVLKAIGK